MHGTRVEISLNYTYIIVPFEGAKSNIEFQDNKLLIQ